MTMTKVLVRDELPGTGMKNYYHAKGEPMSLRDIAHMVEHLTISNESQRPCGHYNLVMNLKAKYLSQYGEQQLIKDALIAQGNRIEYKTC